MGFLIFFPFIGAFMLFWICILISYLVISFILYIFKSFGLLRIAKSENYKYPYIVWIPIVSNYVLGKYCMDKNKSIIYSILTAINLVVSTYLFYLNNEILFYISLIYIVIYFIIDMMVMNKFYKKVYKTPELFTILTVITLGLLKGIFIYTARIKKITKVNLDINEIEIKKEE